MSNFSELRERYPLFEYRDFSVSEDDAEVRVEYTFSATGLTEFKPRWTFFKNSKENFSDNPTFRRMLFSLGMVELVSYWKATCSPRVVVSAGKCSPEQALWWKKLYYKGLGEFFYTNGITTDIESLMSLEFTGEEVSGKGKAVAGDKKMISIGGGKDSAVSLEVLAQYKSSCYCYMINPNASTLGTASVAGFDEGRIISPKRYLDRKIVELNSEGFLNGHTPFSAIVAFSSLVCAYMNDIGEIVLSNESSANESTVSGSDVNHQYSKSYEFEKDFSFYEKEYIDSGIRYFSLLRPLTEFQIARYFAGKKKYHKVFRSCNLGSKTGVWCCDCPKCLFVYIILSPFLSEEEMTDIFGENLLGKEELITTLDKLTGVLPEKPFECVGSRIEVRVSMWLTSKKYLDEGKEPPVLISHYNSLFPEDLSDEYENLVSFCDEENSVPDELCTLVKKEFGLNGRA